MVHSLCLLIFIFFSRSTKCFSWYLSPSLMTNLSGKNLNEHFNCRPPINEKVTIFIFITLSILHSKMFLFQDFSLSRSSFNFGISHRSYQQNIKPPWYLLCEKFKKKWVMIVKKESDRDVRQFSCFNAGFQGDHLKMYFYTKML